MKKLHGPLLFSKQKQCFATKMFGQAPQSN